MEVSDIAQVDVLPHSAQVWLCDKERLIPSGGQSGTLTLSRNEFLFTPQEGQPMLIPLNSLEVVDINNIAGKARIIIHAQGQKYVIELYHPLGWKTFLQPRGRGLVGTVNTVMMAQAWKQAINAAVPPERIKQRKELRLLPTILIGLAVGMALFVALLVFIHIMAART